MEGKRRQQMRGILASLAIGVALGVVVDRGLLRSTPRGPVRPDILGKWVSASDNSPVEFKSDGTYEAVNLTTTIGPDGATKDRIERPEVGHWLWADDGWLEIWSPGHGMARARVVTLGGDTLNVLSEGGGIQEFKRR
jgi:hypothetical protein